MTFSTRSCAIWLMCSKPSLPGKDGLLHISQIAHERVEKVTDYLSEGQIVRVKVLETDEKGRVKLSMKALIERPQADHAHDAAPQA